MNPGTSNPRNPRPSRNPTAACAGRPRSARPAPFREPITSLRSLSSPPPGGSHSRLHRRPDLFTPCVHAPESVRKTVPSPEGPTNMTLSDRICGDTSSPPFFLSRVGRPSGHPATEGSRTAVSPQDFFSLVWTLIAHTTSATDPPIPCRRFDGMRWRACAPPWSDASRHRESLVRDLIRVPLSFHDLRYTSPIPVHISSRFSGGIS